MNRRQSREQAFIFLFESTFGLQSLEEILEYANLIREEVLSDFAEKLFNGVFEHKEIIDDYIEKNLKEWKKDRLSRTALSILRLCVYELVYCKKETPTSVAINEAVEIAKKYGTPEEASYINGVLGAIEKSI